MLTSKPTLKDVQSAQLSTASIVRKTPILTSEYFNDILGI